MNQYDVLIKLLDLAGDGKNGMTSDRWLVIAKPILEHLKSLNEANAVRIPKEASK